MECPACLLLAHVELATDLTDLVPGQFEVALEVQLDWCALQLKGVCDYGGEWPGGVECSGDHA